MSQNGDYNLANQSGSAFRTELNNILGDIKSMNSGSSAPTSPIEGELWYDTDTNVIAVYNGGSFQTIIDVDSKQWLGSAVTLKNTRTFDITGDITATAQSFNGSQNVSISASVNNNSHSHTGSTISALAAGDTTSGVFDVARLGSGPANGEVLTAAGTSGSATWEAAAAGGLGDIETFTSSGTWNFSAAGSPSSVWVCVVGAGGGGGGGNGVAGGGGGGHTVLWQEVAVTDNVTVTIGNGGSGGVATGKTNSSGTSGQNSSFGSVTAGGGSAGRTNGGGGNGNGGSGAAGRASGTGGGSLFGSTSGPATFLGGNGSAGGGYGAGGSGSNFSSAGRIGGGGAPGLVLVAY